jgi:hypothetical protein
VASPPAPIGSLDLIHRAIEVDIAYTISRLQVLEGCPAIRSASPGGASTGGSRQRRATPFTC